MTNEIFFFTSFYQPTLVNALIKSKNNNKAAAGISTSFKRNKSEFENLLTSRETDVLKGIVNGKTNKEIGLSLLISEKTVRNHLYSLFKKLGVSDRTQAAIIALKHNIVDT